MSRCKVNIVPIEAAAVDPRSTRRSLQHVGRCAVVAVVALLVLLPTSASAELPAWPHIFDPGRLMTFDLELAANDWDTIRKDTTNEIEVPAWFSADGEPAILVSVRRKSSRALPSEGNPQKVGLKVDINEFVDGQEWHGLTKLSLENGDPDPIAEGLAWNVHELASVDGFYGAGYHPALASWVRVNVNGDYLGVYSNVEQRDRRLLESRGLYVRGQTWLYEIDDRTGFAFEVGGPEHSAAYDALCYAPFRSKREATCPTPPDAVLETQLSALIEMQAMLTQGAIDALTANGDALFSHGKNYSFADFSPERDLKRRYYPWDLDAAFTGQDANIYGKRKGKTLEQTPFQSVILNHPTFRAMYNQIILGLTEPSGGFAPEGPLSETRLHAFLTTPSSSSDQRSRKTPISASRTRPTRSTPCDSSRARGSRVFAPRRSQTDPRRGVEATETAASTEGGEIRGRRRRQSGDVPAGTLHDDQERQVPVRHAHLAGQEPEAQRPPRRVRQPSEAG